ncbi:MAG: DUF58 domain-containing protein [Lachnospiraceae bacterium]|nr:DUF58 domain-containing protein [Lachnospiraceae bacterium]MBP1584622.1 DUF58 domain-containing protein [Lachnospiraceae bacterium]
MKRNGYIAIGLFILSLIIISNIGGPASYGFFFFTLFVPLVSFIYTIVVYIRFKIYQRIDTRTVTAGNATPFFFTLQNEDVFTHAGVQTHFFTDFSSITDLDDEEYELMPHTGISRETLLLCRYRGEYDVGIKSVTVTDYLRLFSITFKNRETLKAIVLPRLEMLPDTMNPESVIDPAGSLSRNRKIPDIPVREYVSGDDIRFINWKASARTGKPLVRTFTGEENPSCRIIMDPLRYSEDPADHLPLENKILETVLALTYFLAEHGIDVSVYTFNEKLMRYAVNGTDGFEDFYDSMSSFAFRKSNTHEGFFKACDSDESVTECSSVIYILHEWSDAARLYSERLKLYSIRQSLYLITDREDGIRTGADDHMGCRVIGYEDRVSEVLG